MVPAKDGNSPASADLDGFADLYLDLMAAGRAARAAPVLPRLLMEMAARMPPADLAEALMATADARGIAPRGDRALRRAHMMARMAGGRAG